MSLLNISMFRYFTSKARSEFDAATVDTGMRFDECDGGVLEAGIVSSRQWVIYPFSKRLKSEVRS